MLVHCGFAGQAGWPGERSGAGRPAWQDDRLRARTVRLRASVQRSHRGIAVLNLPVSTRTSVVVAREDRRLREIVPVRDRGISALSGRMLNASS